MQKLSKYLKGDLALWGVIFFFALISFLPIYSATSNIVYVEGLKGDIFYHFFRHVRLVIFGLVVAYVVHLMPYRYLRPISRLGLFITWILLLLVVMKGSTIEGANASRWLYIFGISVQPSAIAMIVLLVYVASYLAEIYGQKVTLGDSLLPLWLPVGITVGLVTLPNFSTGAIMFSMVITLVFIGRYPLRHIFSVFVLTIVLAGIFYLFVRAYPDAFPHRVDTWRARIERFFNKDEAKEEDYQSQRAKMAIVSGGLLGQGSGKSVMKNLLSKSYSDFMGRSGYYFVLHHNVGTIYDYLPEGSYYLWEALGTRSGTPDCLSSFYKYGSIGRIASCNGAEPTLLLQRGILYCNDLPCPRNCPSSE